MSERDHASRCVLIVEVGNRNTGDEVLCAAATRRFIAAGWNVSVACRVRPRGEVFAGLPVHVVDLLVEDNFAGVERAGDLLAMFAGRHPDKFGLTRELVSGHDLVAIAPGGRFTSGYNNPRALLTAAVAQSLGVPVVNLHQSVGPMEIAGHRQLLAEIFSRCELNLIRDDLSHAFLLRLGVPENLLVLTRDPAFCERFTPPAMPSYEVGLNIRCGFNGRVNLHVLKELLIQLRSSLPGIRILVYSTTHAPDENVREAVGRLADVADELPRWDECLQLPGACMVNVSDSFHGMIFSMLAGRPVICCQTDYATWKIQGTRATGIPDIEIMAGLSNADEIPRILLRVRAALDDPQQIIRVQDRRLEQARALSEKGWQALWAVLKTTAKRRASACA